MYAIRSYYVHRVVQFVLLALLLYMALLFQEKFMEKYASLKPFYTSLVLTLLIQAVVFFPVRKFAENDARRELRVAAATALTAEEQKQLRSQRLLSDFLKASVFIFFVAFILLLKEQATVFQSTVITSYSIHYTKLYEWPNPWRKWKRTVFRFRKRSKKCWLEAMPRSTSWRTAKPSIMILRPKPRITSYNVCYTKLLRPAMTAMA